MIEYKVGDTVYVNFNNNWNISVGVGKVVKVTPTGRVNVTFADGRICKFDKIGHQIGGSIYRYAKLIDETEYDKLIALKERQRIDNNMRKMFSAYPGIRSDKVLIAALIAKLTEMAEALK